MSPRTAWFIEHVQDHPKLHREILPRKIKRKKEKQKKITKASELEKQIS